MYIKVYFQKLFLRLRCFLCNTKAEGVFRYAMNSMKTRVDLAVLQYVTDTECNETEVNGHGRDNLTTLP